MRFDISFGKSAPILIATGMPPGRCWIDIDDERVQVRMSWAFRAEIPAGSIGEVTDLGDQKLGSIGVHGWRGRWLVNGSLRGLVSIAIDPAARCRVIGVPQKLSELVVSVDEPATFIAALDASASSA